MQLTLISLISGIMVASIYQFVTYQYGRRQKTIYRMGVSFELFYTLLIIYCIVITGFGLIYFLLSFYQVILIDAGQTGVEHRIALDTLFRSFYFSGVTMLTIGYGDIIPLGIGRFVVVIQALIGYLLPTSFVLKLVQMNVEALLKHRK